MRRNEATGKDKTKRGRGGRLTRVGGLRKAGDEAAVRGAVYTCDSAFTQLRLPEGRWGRDTLRVELT